MKSKFLAIIPARSGSKGILKKNIVNLCNKPLIQYTIEPAVRLKEEQKIIDVIVSTDSKEIASISSNLGANVPFLRPKKLATDKAKTIDVVLHIINYLGDKRDFFNTIILLQPTAPLRSYTDIKNAIDIFDIKLSCSLISVYKEEYLSDLIMYKKEGPFALPLNKNHNKGLRRQENEELYIRNGAIYVTSVNFLMKEKKIISNSPLLYEMTKNRSINIDSYKDLEIAQCLLKR